VVAKLKSKDYPVSALVDAINEGYIEGWLSKAGRVDKRHIKPAPPADPPDTKPVLTDEEARDAIASIRGIRDIESHNPVATVLVPGIENPYIDDDLEPNDPMLGFKSIAEIPIVEELE
jgi:hypothetical protein